MAASLERGSEHPLAAAIVQAATERHLQLGTTTDFESIPGKGVTGRVNTAPVVLGNFALMETLEIDASDSAQKAEELRNEGQTVMFVALEGKVAGLLGVADPIKDSTPDAIQELQAEGIRVVRTQFRSFRPKAFELSCSRATVELQLRPWQPNWRSTK
jgi:Cu+-exporting ATPase